MQVWNVLQAAGWKCRMQKVAKNRHLDTIAQLCRTIFSQLGHILTSGKKLVKQQCLPHMSLQYGELQPTSGRDHSLVWGTPANVNAFRFLTALLHGTLVEGVSQNLRRWTEGATYIRQGGHDVGHWPTCLVFFKFFFVVCCKLLLNCRMLLFVCVCSSSSRSWCYL